MTREEATAYFKECNEKLVSVAKDENVYDYEKQVIEADCMRRSFEANEKAIQALEQQPKMGEWYRISPQDIYECSNCGGYVMPSDIKEYEYCNHCGCRMNGGGEE